MTANRLAAAMLSLSLLLCSAARAEDPFRSAPGPVAAPAPAPRLHRLRPHQVEPPAADQDTMFWQSIAQSTSPADFEAYLRQFPHGRFAALARNRLAGLQPSAASAIAPPTASPAQFSGAWWVKMACSDIPAAQTRGYVREFVAQINNGVLHAEAGRRGEANWFSLEGLVRADGTLQLYGHGLTGGDPRYNTKHVGPGSPYSFEGSGRLGPISGTGKRVTGRPCDFTFTK